MFRKLFGKSSPQAAVSPAITRALSDSILATLGPKSIPPMPAAAQKAFQLSTDPNAEARDFIDVIESDEALSARVLKIANSVYFDRGKQSKTIEESVLVIGIEELRSLLNANALSDLFASRQAIRPQLWANDIATAIIAKALAQRFLPQQSGVAFLGGLMHDIGKLLMLQRAPDQYQKVAKLVEDRGLDFCAAEQEIFVFNHAEVGHLIAERWNFTPELLAMISLHHQPYERLQSGPTPSLPMLVKAADGLAHALGLGHSARQNRLRIHAQEQLDATWDALKFPNEERQAALQNYEHQYSVEYELYAGKGM